MINIPDRALYNRRIPKNKFYEKIVIDKKLEKKFIDEIDQIIWKYKLSESTVNLESKDDVEEIQIFEIGLKEKHISREVLENIDRVIPYPILYILKYNNDIKLTIAYKERNKLDSNKMVVHSYYQSEWTKEDKVKIDVLKGISLKDVYENIIKQLIPIESTFEDNIEELIQLNERRKTLKNEISRLEKSIKKEKQFNKKVELNIKLHKKKKELEALMES